MASNGDVVAVDPRLPCGTERGAPVRVLVLLLFIFPLMLFRKSAWLMITDEGVREADQAEDSLQGEIIDSKRSDGLGTLDEVPEATNSKKSDGHNVEPALTARNVTKEWPNTLEKSGSNISTETGRNADRLAVPERGSVVVEKDEGRNSTNLALNGSQSGEEGTRNYQNGPNLRGGGEHESTASDRAGTMRNGTNDGQKVHPSGTERVTFIALSGAYGRTCNNLKAIATVMYRAAQEARGVALDEYHSSILDNTGLDIARFTRYDDNVPLLLDCTFRQSTETSCRRRYLNGTRTNGTKFDIKVSRMIIGEHAYYDMLYRIEIMNVMLWFRLPEADEEMIDVILQRLRTASKSAITVGAHRRALEGQCYQRLVRQIHAPPYQNHSLFAPGGRCFNVTDNGLNVGEPIETCYREVSMLYSVCNFTFSSGEAQYVRQISGWGDFLNRRDFGLLLATDRQLPYGDTAIKKSVPVTFQLADLLPRRYPEVGLLMREMYALSRVDYFISQPLSSCDWIIHFWRVRRWNRTLNSTFPPNQIPKYFDT